MVSKQEFKHLLVRKLRNKGIIGAAHKPEKNFLWFLRNCDKAEQKMAFDALEELIKEEVIIRAKKNRDVHVSLTSDVKKYAQYIA